jgi:hypothetical protein
VIDTDVVAALMRSRLPGLPPGMCSPSIEPARFAARW